MISVTVVGGGAAGLTAAISAARNGAKVNVLEKGTRPGSKILATGGGRCNYTNTNLGSDKYFADSDFINSIIYKFDASDAISFFESLGVYSISRAGYVYPRTEESATILDALLKECDRLGVVIHNNTLVTDIKINDGEFEIFTEGYTYKSDKVILACGGMNEANDQNGYKLAASFGHEIEDTYPALTAIVFKDEITKASGVRTLAKISFNCGSLVFEETGEVQITEFGMSGIPIMNNSRYVALALGGGNDVKITIDFLPDISDESYKAIISGGASLYGLLPKRLARIIEKNNKNPKEYSIKIDGVKGFERAQVTHGGVSLYEINPETMESFLTPGLYLTGEMLDVDGVCGGYNLHFAWASGIIAGTSSAGKSYEHIMPSIEKLRRWENMDIGSRRESNE